MSVISHYVMSLNISVLTGSLNLLAQQTHNSSTRVALFVIHICSVIYSYLQ